MNYGTVSGLLNLYLMNDISILVSLGILVGD